MQGYLEVPVTSSRIVTLPRDIETPIQVNVGDNPSFSRTKLFEFTMNGPGSNYTPTDWAWEDRGSVPVLQQPPAPIAIRFLSSDAGDNSSKKIYVTGRIAPISPETLGHEVTETISLNGTSNVTSTNTYASITRILKDPTAGTVSLSTTLGVTLSFYAPDETEPSYRQIRLSKSGTTAHILFRRTVFRVSTVNDYIPCQSRMGLLMMLRANEFYRKATSEDLKTGALLEQQAQKFVEEEQKSRNVFAEISSQTQRDKVYGLNINNRDSIIAADVYDDISQICGPVGQSTVFDRITEGLELLVNKGQWEGLEGYVDISADSQKFVTLPRYVDIPMAINIGNGPSKMRNRWAEFHLNGPGSNCSVSCNQWEDHGDVVTITDLTEAQGLIYKPDSSSDNGKTITIYGYDSADKYTSFTLAGNSTYNFSNLSSQTIKRITRITRDATIGYAQLIAYDATGATPTQLGYYAPDETEPNYRRIKLPCNTCWIRMRYRKRMLKIDSLTSPLHLRSRLAILAAVGSLSALRSEKPDLQTSEALEKKALQYLTEEKIARNPAGVWHIQFDRQTSMASPEQGMY